MKKNIILNIFLFIFFSLLLFGCQNNKIEFYRESKANALMQKFPTKKTTTTTTKSGIIILKDDTNNDNDINFGPRDIIFDMPMKLK